MTTVHEEVNEETQHYIVYGEWKIYDEEGNYHCKTGDIELYKTLEEATESFNKMIEEEKNGDQNDYDLIYLDCMEEEDDFEEGDELYQCNIDCWKKPLFIDGYQLEEDDIACGCESDDEYSVSQSGCDNIACGEKEEEEEYDNRDKEDGIIWGAYCSKKE